jgi:hypothetical protein
MLKDELLLVAGFEDHGVFIERSDTAGQLHSANQINRYVVPFLSRCIEEGILNVLLRRLGFHLPISFFLSGIDAAPPAQGKGNRPQLSPVGSYNTASPQAFQLPTE